jgi:hypothetical protein
MPMEFRTILQQYRHILHCIPAMGAEAGQQWAKARYGVRLILRVGTSSGGINPIEYPLRFALNTVAPFG